jgi:hypothetical protein
MKDPTWYGRSGRYFGGETVGLTKAGAQVLVGGAKLAYDIGNALDPLEAWKSGDAWSAVGKDILGTVKGAKSGVDALGEVVKAGWDIAASSWGGGDPASHADPVKFGEAVGNAAMTVDGAANLTRLIEGRIAAAQAPETAIRGTSELLGPGAEAWQAAKKTQAKSAAKLEASTTVGKIKAHPIASAVFRKKAVGEAYIDQTPIQMGRDTATADKAVRNEIETHANSLSSQIDKKYPQGSIKADDVKTKLEASLTEEVAAPKLKSAKGQPVVTRHPVIQQLMLQIKKTSPGMWTFEQTRQIREMLGRSLDYLEGPDKAVGVQAYIEFTDRLKASAKASGLEKTWNQYNGLAKDYYQLYANMIDDMKHAQSGKEVFNVLKKDPARTSRLAHGLARYGLDYNKFMKRYNRGVRIMSMQDATNRTAFYYANRLGGGLVATVGLRAAGATGYEAMIGGFSLGLAMNQAVNIARALQLTGDMNWHFVVKCLLRLLSFLKGRSQGQFRLRGRHHLRGLPLRDRLLPHRFLFQEHLLLQHRFREERLQYPKRQRLLK